MGPFFVGQVPSSPQVFNLVNDDGSSRDLTGFSSVNLITVGPDGTLISEPTMGNVTLAGTASPNQIILSWNSSQSPFALAGLYRFQFALAGPGDVKDYSDVGVFIVNTTADSDIGVTWATINDVMIVTGEVVSIQDLTMAQAVIDLYSNRTIAVSARIRPRDVGWLKRAVSYQAVWQKGQADLFTRMAPSEVNQDGVIAKFPTRTSLHLSPLAERALRNVSWMRTRSIRSRSTFVDGQGYPGMDPLIDDSIFNWNPM